MHVDGAVHLIAVPDAATIGPRTVADPLEFRVDTILQSGQRNHGLEGRTRRESGAERLVVQRLAVVFGKSLVFDAGQTLNEAVGVETRRGQQAEHVAAAAIHHHRRAAVLAEDLQAAVLDVGVEGQLDRRARDRRDIAGGVVADDPTLDVDLHLARAGRAAQLEIKCFFNTLLADPEARIEQDRFSVGAGLGDVLGADLGDIADHMREGAGKRIDPHLAHVGGDAGQFGRADIDARKLFPRHVFHQGHWRLAGRRVDIGAQPPKPGLIHRNQGDQIGEGRVDVDVVVLGQQQTKVRSVGGQHNAIAIKDQSARRRG